MKRISVSAGDLVGENEQVFVPPGRRHTLDSAPVAALRAPSPCPIESRVTVEHDNPHSAGTRDRGTTSGLETKRRSERISPFSAVAVEGARPLPGCYYGGPLDIAPNAARFDVSLAWFAWAGAAVSLELLCQWQSDGLLEQVVGLARRLAAQLGLPTPAGSVISVPVGDAESIREALSAAGIKAAVRAGSVRLSPHVYNTAEQIDRAAAVLGRLV